MTQPIEVVFFPADIDGCALWRMYMPHLNIPGSRFMFRMGPVDLREIQGIKIAIVQRQVSDHNRIAIQRMRAAGIKVIYDTDDNLWDLPSANPGKQVFDSCKEGFWKCAKEADAITVSTQRLASAARTGFRLDKPIFIVSNAIDFDLFQAKPLVRDNLVMIGWGGSTTHAEDCKDVFDMMPEVLDKNPTALMQIVGAAALDIKDTWKDKFDKYGRKLGSAKTRAVVVNKLAVHPQCGYRSGCKVGEYANRFASWGWDISIAPLVDSRFNRSKSNIKMLEAASIKIPCLVSDVQPYREFCELGGDDLKWLLCNSISQWKTKLTTLINEPEMRKDIGQKMYDVAFKFYNAATMASNWMYVFQQVLAI